MKFEVLDPIRGMEVIARGPGVQIRSYLRKAYGRGRWRKVKGIATVRLPNAARRNVELHWYVSAWDRKARHEDQEIPGRNMKPSAKPFALCIDNTDYKASLIPGKVYRIIPDPKAAKDDLVRIVDESGEDYLYHKSYFLFVEFPRAIAKRILTLEDIS